MDIIIATIDKQTQRKEVLKMECKRKTVINYEVRKIYSVKTTEILEVETRLGDGTDENPVRKEIQYWTKEGDFIGVLTPRNCR